MVNFDYLRPCTVTDKDFSEKRGLFHGWMDFEKPEYDGDQAVGSFIAAQRKGWLPPQYGRKRYHDMSDDERHVVDSFQGQKKYEEVMARADYFLTDGANPMMMLGA